MSTVTPSLPIPKAEYLRHGVKRVHGWLNPSTAVYLSSLEVLQRAMPVTGDMCEIGVHHGKSFLCLALGLPPDQRAVAIDVLEDQAANLDGSGRGDRAAFELSLAEHGAGDSVDLIQSSSLDLEKRGFLEWGRRFRLFSIDGGHTAEVTCNDLQLAERTVVKRGVVVLDDLLNRHWLGVITGLFQYWSKGGTLVPSVVVPNKLLLARSIDEAMGYRRLMAEHFKLALEKSRVPLGHYEVDVYGEFLWTVLDDAGRTGVLVGGARPSATRGQAATQVVPTSYLDQLEKDRRELLQKLRRAEAPLRRKLARRLPRLTRTVYPAYALIRSSVQRFRGSAREP
jgi:predicted O-methyltransferase YrrM